jgi:hybrid cluster-associated redox disulfide protein
MNKITLDMTIAEVLVINPEIAPVFFEYGMHCLSCPVASAETIAEAAEVHGIDLNQLLQDLNK